MKVYGYTLYIVNAKYQTVKMPKGAEILNAGFQNGQLVLWAKVYPEHGLEDRVIEIFGTGVEMPSLGPGQERIYISTLQMNGYALHIFELK